MEQTHRRLSGTFVDQMLSQARDRLVTIDANAALTRAAELLFEASCRVVVVCDARGHLSYCARRRLLPIRFVASLVSNLVYVRSLMNWPT
jgi:hypothetical protein